MNEGVVRVLLYSLLTVWSIDSEIPFNHIICQVTCILCNLPALFWKEEVTIQVLYRAWSHVACLRYELYGRVSFLVDVCTLTVCDMTWIFWRSYFLRQCSLFVCRAARYCAWMKGIMQHFFMIVQSSYLTDVLVDDNVTEVLVKLCFLCNNFVFIIVIVPPLCYLRKYHVLVMNI